MMNVPARRSKLGVASFIISIGTFSTVVVLLIIALMVVDKHSHGADEIFGQFVFSTFLFAAPVAHLVGLILGIIALFQKRYGKFFAVFGIILNILFPALGVLIVFLLLSAVAGFR